MGFQIPEYNTTFTDSVTRAAYTLSTNTVSLPNVGLCSYSFCQARTSESITVSDLCTFQVKSLISPAIPNAKVFNSYALSEAVSPENCRPLIFRNAILVVLSNLTKLPL